MRKFTRKCQMGVEAFSFHEWQQAKREAEARGQVPPRPVSRYGGMWEEMFGTPPEVAPAAGPGPTATPETVRPLFPRPQETRVDANQWFKVPMLWNHIEENISAFSGNKVPIDQLTRPTADFNQATGEVVTFFGIPAEKFRNMSLEMAWQLVIWPLLQEISISMNRSRPAGVPGILRLEMSGDNALFIVYQDQ